MTQSFQQLEQDYRKQSLENTELRALVQMASNLIADDLTDADETSAPEHFAFLNQAAEVLAKK